MNHTTAQIITTQTIQREGVVCDEDLREVSTNTPCTIEALCSPPEGPAQSRSSYYTLTQHLIPHRTTPLIAIILLLALLTLSCADTTTSGSETSTTQRLNATVDCQPLDEPLLYDCTVLMTDRDSGEPVNDAEFSVGADMPSMAGAHNVRPVEAQRLDKPGHYGATIQLEMLGEWALSLDIEKPGRDRIVEKLMFMGDGEMDGGHEHGSGE
ncbi:MAG: FixH family protein [Chloroflexota bacterium]